MKKHSVVLMLILAILATACPNPGVETGTEQPQTTSIPDASIFMDAGQSDMDGDTIPDSQDNCPAVSNRTQANFDGDDFGDACDNCPTDPLRHNPSELNPCVQMVQPEEDAGQEPDSGVQTPDAGNAIRSVRVIAHGPSSASIPSGTSNATVLSFVLENNTENTVSLESISLERTGILAGSNILGIVAQTHLGRVHGSRFTLGLNGTAATLAFPSDPIEVPGNTQATIEVGIALTSSASSGTIGFRIPNQSYLIVHDQNHDPITLDGIFPIESMMNVVSGTGALGAVMIESNIVFGGTPSAPIYVYPGTTNVDVGKFRIQETTGNENVMLYGLIMQFTGTALKTDLLNPRIIDQNNAEIPTVLTLSPHGLHVGVAQGIPIPAGSTTYLTLRMDIAESAVPGRTINVVIPNEFRVQTQGMTTGYGVMIYAGNGSDFPIGDTDPGSNWAKIAGNITEDGGSLTSNLVVSNADGVVPDRVLPGGGSPLIAAFDLREFVTDIEVQQLGFVVLDGNGNPLETGDHALAGVLIAETDSGTALSIVATSSDVYGGTCTISSGIVSGTCGGPQGTSAWSLSTLFTVAGGSTKRLIFRAGMNQYATQNDSYSVMLTYVKARQINNGVTVTYFPNVRSQPGVQVAESPTLTVIKSPGFNPVNAVRGGTLQKIGSFDLINGGYEPIRVNAVKIRVCAKSTTITSVIDCELSNQSEIAAVTNVTLMVGGVQLAPSQNITTTLGGTFSTQYEFGENITGTINVHAVVSSMYSSANLAVTLTVVSATGTYTQNTISLAEVLGQSLYISSGGALAVQSLGPDGVTNDDKLVHAGEVDIPLFKFKVTETTNSEAMTLGKIHFAVQNAANTLQNFRLMDESTGMFHGVAVNPNILVGSHGEIQFNGLTVPFARGGERNFIVKATAVSASGMATSNQDVKLVVTFVEYTGDVSGTTTRVSGGMVVGQSTSDAAGVSLFVPGGDFLQVWDTARYEVGDLVSFDMMNNGTFTGPYAIKSVGNNTITLSQTLLPDGPTLDILGSVYAGARLTAHPFTSRNTQVQEIEPTMVGLNVGSGNQVSENEMGVFVIRNEGERSLRIRELQFEISGSYDFASGYGPRNFKLDRADPTTGLRIANTLNAGSSLSPPQNNANDENVSPVVPVASGTVLEWNLDQAGIVEEIGPGSSKAYVVIANTTSIKNNSVSGSTAMTQVRMLGTRGSPVMGSNDGLLWSYTRTASGFDSGTLTISDSYIVSGKSMLYQ